MTEEKIICIKARSIGMLNYEKVHWKALHVLLKLGRNCAGTNEPCLAEPAEILRHYGTCICILYLLVIMRKIRVYDRWHNSFRSYDAMNMNSNDLSSF